MLRSVTYPAITTRLAISETFNGDSSRINFYNVASERGLSSYDTPVNNVTGLIWDMKVTTASNARLNSNTYSWRNTNGAARRSSARCCQRSLNASEQ